MSLLGRVVSETPTVSSETQVLRVNALSRACLAYQGKKGDKGDTGETGAQGPAGANGQNGADGQNGVDGVSPAVSVTDIAGGHRITITDATHTGAGALTFDVMDGAVPSYSVNEQDTGLKWIDGKTIYQKTIVHPLGWNNEEQIDLPAGAETVIGFDGMIINDDDGRIVLPLCYADINEYQQLYVKINNASIAGPDFDAPKILVETTLDVTGYTLYLTVRYTKEAV